MEKHQHPETQEQVEKNIQIQHRSQLLNKRGNIHVQVRIAGFLQHAVAGFLGVDALPRRGEGTDDREGLFGGGD